MRTGDILGLTNHPSAEHRRALERRRGVIGAIVAAGLLVMALAGAYWVRPAQAIGPDIGELSTFTSERGGTLSSLEIVY